MNKKIIFLDIDGTLTEAGSNVPPESACKAIEAARAKGNYVFLCTGRNYGMLSPLLKYGFDGAIGSSGGYIVCGDKVIFDCPMTDEQRIRAMEVCEKNRIYRTVESVDGAYTDDSLKEFLAAHAEEGSNSELLRWRRQLETSLNIRSMKEYKEQPIYKLVVMCESDAQLKEPRSVLEEEFQFCIQEPNEYGFINGEILSRQYNKGTAVRRVCEYLGVPLEDSITFGDSMNDLEMMEESGFSICMENGAKALKAIADDVCPSVTEDGLIFAFRKYGLM